MLLRKTNKRALEKFFRGYGGMVDATDLIILSLFKEI
jgi:hypothetical protein